MPEAPDPILRYFKYDHLPEHLQLTSKLFHNLAHGLVAMTPKNPERSAGLRKLLEAKDCFVRAGLPEEA